MTELYDKGDVCGTRRWQVRGTFVRHHARYFSAVAFRVDMDGKSVVIGGDTTPDEEMLVLAAGADVLIHEGSYLKEGLLAAAMEEAHCSAEDAADIAARAGVNIGNRGRSNAARRDAAPAECRRTCTTGC